MKEKKKIKVAISGSVKVDPKILSEAKQYCKENGILVSFYATEALKDKLNKDKNK